MGQAILDALEDIASILERIEQKLDLIEDNR